MVDEVMRNRTFWDDSAAYNPKRYGSLEKYLSRQFDNVGTYCLFRGVGQFRMLWNEGYLVPKVSCIRLMYNVGRGDEHYLVIDESTLEGLAAGMHAGKPGRHNVRNILNKNAPPFEAQSLRNKSTGLIEY